MSRPGPLGACVAALLLAARAARGAGPLEVDTWIGDRTRLRTGLVQEVLNLDPELVEVAVVEAGVLEVLGRQYGVATLRVWTVEGPLVVRVRVRGLRPAAPAGAEEGRSGPGLLASLRQFAYASQSGTDLVTAQSIAGSLPLGRGRGRVEAWLEERGGGVVVPHYLVELDRPGGDAGSGLHAAGGDLTLDWGRFTFARDRIEAGLLELGLSPLEGRPRLGITLVGGRDAPDGVALGSRFPAAVQAGGSRYGGRLRWKPRDGLALSGEVVAHDPAPGELDLVGSGGFDLATERVRARGSAGFDGLRWAGTGSVDVNVGGATLHLDGEATGHGFRTPVGALTGVRAVNGTLTQRLGERLGLELAGSFRDLDPSAFASPEATTCPGGRCEPARWTRAGFRRLGAWWKAGDAVTLRADLETSEQGLGDRRWEVSFGGVEAGFDLGRRLRAAGRLRVESSSQRAEGRVEGSWSWTSVRLDGRLQPLAWLAVDGSVERRFAASVPGEAPAPWLWSAGVRGRLPRLGPVATLAVSGAYRSWEHLNTVDGTFAHGRYLSASLEAGSRAWHGLRLELRGSFNRDLDSREDGAALEAALVLALDRPGRPPRDDGGLRTVEGRAFADADGDGLPDRGDAGVAGVLFRLSDGREARTGRTGRFRFRRVGAGASVRLVTEALPAGLVLRGPSIRSVASAGAGPPELSFGLGPPGGRLEVVAFNDLDGDDAYDPEEPPLSGVALVLEGGKTLHTSADGRARHEAPSGAAVSGRVVDESLPSGYRWGRSAPLPPVVLSAAAPVLWQIPLRAWRAVRGTVSLVVEGAGRGSPAEPAGSGVVVTAGPRVAVTDAKGRFTLSDLPPGKVRIALHEAGLPAGWAARGPVEVELGPGPCVAEVELRLLPSGPASSAVPKR